LNDALWCFWRRLGKDFKQNYRVTINPVDDSPVLILIPNAKFMASFSD